MPMDEIGQIEAELRKLREVADHEKNRAGGLEKEKKTLEARNEYLVNKMKEASYVYGEAGKRLLYFINNQVNPIIERLNRLEAEQKKAAGQAGVLGDSVLTAEKAEKDDFMKLSARTETLVISLSALQAKTEAAMKAVARRGAASDAALENAIAAQAAETGKKLEAYALAFEKKNAARMAVFERGIAAKMGTLKERNLILGKDLEELSGVRKDVSGLDEKLQALVTHITQMRIDLEKSVQKAESDVAAVSAASAKQSEIVLSQAEKRMITLSAQLRAETEKALSATRLAIEESGREADAAAAESEARVKALEGALHARISKADVLLKKDFRMLSGDLEKRMRILEAGITKNDEVQREFGKAVALKLEGINRGMGATEERIIKAEEAIMENAGIARQAAKMADGALKAHVERMEKSIDNKVGKAIAALDRQNLQARAKMNEEMAAGISGAERKIGLLGKDIGTLRSGLSVIQNMNAELVKRKEETAALQARVSAIAKDISGKYEKDDMRISKQVEVMESKIKASIEAAESRMVRENVRSFAAARHSLKTDIQALREENATLKAEVKNLKAMGALVTGIQHGMTALDRKFESSVSDVEKLSASISADIENQALRAGKGMSDFSARLKADMRDMLAKERERFAGQSADLEGRYAAVSKKLDIIASQAAAGSAASQANGKAIAATQTETKRLFSELSILRKRYAAEMAKLLKEIEG